MKIKNLSLIFLFCGMQSLVFAQSSPIYVNGNNVGIGTTTPVMKLDVYSGGVHIGHDPTDGNLGKLSFHHSHNNSQNRYYSGVLYDNNSGTTSLVGARYNIRYWNAPGFGVQFSAATWDDTQYKYVFRKDMYLDGSSGNLGVGTNQPTQKLHVIGNARIETGIETGGTVTANRFVGDGSGLRNLSLVSSQWGSGSGGAISYLGGNVGIGTTTPTQKLQVKGQILVNQNEGGTSGLYLRSDAAPTHYNWKISTQEVVDGGFEIASSTVPGGTTFKKPIFVINHNGKVGIGDIYPTNELTVSGSIKATDIIISQASWADFVFEPGYRLRPLPELESFILTQKHLPDVPTEKEVVSKGMSVASMQKLHMQKIEELTLYVIALEKENKKLKEAQDDLLKRMVRLEAQSR